MNNYVSPFLEQPVIKGQKMQFILVLALLVFQAVSCKDNTRGPDAADLPTEYTSSLPRQSLTIAGKAFTVELAYTRQSRAQGLMFRRNLPANAGMLFIFDRSVYRQFYMKNCLIDLDIIYIKSSGRIAKITTMKAPIPGKKLILYPSGQPVKYALELPAGTAERLKLKPNQKINLPKRVRSIIPEPE